MRIVPNVIFLPTAIHARPQPILVHAVGGFPAATNGSHPGELPTRRFLPEKAPPRKHLLGREPLIRPKDLIGSSRDKYLKGGHPRWYSAQRDSQPFGAEVSS